MAHEDASRKEIELDLPGLGITNYEIVSEEDERYNCVSWANRDKKQFWWPFPRYGTYWPPGVKRDRTLDAFIKVFEVQSYQQCDTADFEPGVDKVAIFVRNEKPQHVSRQRAEDGMWTSKLGDGHDIDHESLYALEGDYYGTVAQILKRKRRP
jgi:hypothetical protein